MRHTPRNGPPTRRSPLLALTFPIAVATLLGAPAPQGLPTTDAAPTSDSRTTASARTPPLRVTTVARRLDIPWDVQQLPSGRLLVTERSARRLLTVHRGRVRVVGFPSSSVWASGETGLMSLAVDPQFSQNRRIYTCQGSVAGAGHDVRVLAWRLNRAATRVARLRVLLRGLPASTGRHGGCRLLIRRNGALLVGTGDAAVGSNPRNLGSLGGKTLQVNRFTGAPYPTNPFIRSSSTRARYVLTYGHRNVQGLAERGDRSLYSVEHGPDRDDEINKLAAGRDYGWHPVPGYNESVPMTDQALPGTQVAARWRSGVPTLAVSGATWVAGKAWGSYRGALAVAALKGQRLIFMHFTASGVHRFSRTPPALRRHGRLRSVTRIRGGDLLVTTSNGGRRDVILRVHPGR